jgi:hypothetical protein
LLLRVRLRFSLYIRVLVLSVNWLLQIYCIQHIQRSLAHIAHFREINIISKRLSEYTC